MWQVIVPVKSWDTGKSRLAVVPELRAHYARAMATDTLTAIGQCSLVGSVVVVATPAASQQAPVAELADLTDLADLMLVHPPTMSLNAAISWAVDRTPHLDDIAGTVVVVADLPALRADELSAALTTAADHSRSMVTDRHHTGTTLLAATWGSPLVPAFGGQSAARHHAGGATCLDDLVDSRSLAGLRCDVDRIADLRAARGLGLGRRTLAVDARLGSPP